MVALRFLVFRPAIEDASSGRAGKIAELETRGGLA
jgi:hypothetical protein